VSWFLLLALFSAYYMFYARFHVRMSPEEVLAVGTQVMNDIPTALKQDEDY
jgi:hypothetical protein